MPERMGATQGAVNDEVERMSDADFPSNLRLRRDLEAPGPVPPGGIRALSPGSQILKSILGAIFA